MEKIASLKNSAYIHIEAGSFTFDTAGRLSFSAVMSHELAGLDAVFLLDIYAIDDHRHPEGHAGWWQCAQTSELQVEVELTAYEDMGRDGLGMRFNGMEAENAWVNPDFRFSDRVLIVYLVLRERVSSAIFYEDAVLLYPRPEASRTAVSVEPSGQNGLQDSASLPSLFTLPADVPSRWFVWPSTSTVHLVFASFTNAGAMQFCSHCAALLRHNRIPHILYAGLHKPEQRAWMYPARYIQHTVKEQDVIFYVHETGDPCLHLVAELPCKKILYYQHPHDYRRFQPFDAELARAMEQGQHQIIWLNSFDALCPESESAREFLTARLLERFEEDLAAPATGLAQNGVKQPQNPGPVIMEKSVYYRLPEDAPGLLPGCRHIALLQPKLPVFLEAFTPALWPADWDGVPETPCSVPNPFLLSVGSFRPDKHHEQTLRVFAALARCHPAIGLVIAGWPANKGYWDYLRFLRGHTHADIADRIVFLQGCTQGQLLNLYKRASLFISSGGYEGHSASLEEALHFNLPILARSTGFTRSILGCSGMQFPAQSLPEDIATEALRLLEDPVARQRCLVAQQAQLQRLRENNPAQGFLRALDRILTTDKKAKGEEYA